jgi:tungstate transport system ATP-binding protein
VSAGPVAAEAPATAPALEVSGLAVHRGGVQVLDVPVLSLRAGSVLALIGPNGSGKTTLLKTLACLLEPAAGSLRFQGRELASRLDRQAYRKRVTMVFQDPLLLDTTVVRNLETGLRLRGVPAPERRERVLDAARRFGIEHLLGRRAHRLSGGEAQRASLARAFVLRPEILFLDEPFSALDPPTREGLLEDLGAALRQTGTTTVLATHDQNEALRLADTLAVMHLGRIVQTGSGVEVVNRPVDEFVAAFVGMETVLPGQVAESRQGLCTVAVGGAQVHCVGGPQPGTPVLVGIRPENVLLSDHDGAGHSARNHFPATVTRVVPKGPFFKVELDCGFFLAAFVTPGALEELALAPGRAVVASFKATAVHLITRG